MKPKYPRDSSDSTSSPSPKKPRGTTSTSPKKPRGKFSIPTPWTAAEDALITSLRNMTPPSSWGAVTSSVNALLPGGRTLNAIRLRWHTVLKLASGDPLSEIEKDLLEKAVQDVESMSDKWWFVAARYMELKRGKEQAREMGKVGVRKWWGVVKEERAGKGNTGKVKGEKVKYEEE